MNLFISNKLKYFIAVMEEGSVSKACQRMHISRTPMSKAISDIEQSLGVPLFIRTKEGMTPSKFGTILYNKIVPYYNDLVKIEHCMYTDDGLPVTRIMCSRNIPRSIISHLSVALSNSNINNEFTLADEIKQDDLSSELHFYDIVIADKNFTSQYARAEPVSFDIYINSTHAACEKMIRGGEVDIYHDFDSDSSVTDLFTRDKIKFRNIKKISDSDLIDMMYRVNNHHAVIISTDPLLSLLNVDGATVLKRSVINKTLWFYSQWKAKNNKETAQVMSRVFADLKKSGHTSNELSR
ncbi:LysR family transcriptional regulator [Pseudescherichia sp.]|uniref:LysR family transcriptional regulator n=1 Tax=Pseudescherichia sp. TaxID=2055881 RepID=UPI0028966C1F|nr:LysR family transcriptional regulator [Pseudescherichia sp.]